ncbi:MAG: hypothetical protein N3F03_05480, partial [Ignavibacteria bacterium]|nr:hypothetical protein [Ignavibacteria bacterium]
MKVPFYYWFVVFFYALVIFLANFGETQVAAFSSFGFAFWFVMLVFAGCLGFIVSYLFGLKKSLWIIGIVFLGISFLSSLLVSIKPSLFDYNAFSLSIISIQILKILLSSIFGLLGVLIWQNIFLTRELVRA